MKEPQEVLMDIQLDWKRKGISIKSATQKLGYKTRQSIYNIFSSNKYLKPSLADRFSEIFGYNPDYLKFGAGNLFNNPIGRTTPNAYMLNNVKNNLKTNEEQAIFDKGYTKAIRDFRNRLEERYRELVKKGRIDNNTYSQIIACIETTYQELFMADVRVGMDELIYPQKHDK